MVRRAVRLLQVLWVVSSGETDTASPCIQELPSNSVFKASSFTSSTFSGMINNTAVLPSIVKFNSSSEMLPHPSCARECSGSSAYPADASSMPSLQPQQELPYPPLPDNTARHYTYPPRRMLFQGAGCMGHIITAAMRIAFTVIIGLWWSFLCVDVGHGFLHAWEQYNAARLSGMLVASAYGAILISGASGLLLCGPGWLEERMDPMRHDHIATGRYSPTCCETAVQIVAVVSMLGSGLAGQCLGVALSMVGLHLCRGLGD